VADIDVLKDLQRLTWRGISVPVTARTVNFSHDDVRHKFEFRDGQIVESTGVQNYTFRYTVPFRQGIRRGQYANLFTDVLPRFIVACRNRSADTLIDPVLGSFRARVLTFSDETDVNRRDGDDVTVEFIEAPLLNDSAVENENANAVKSQALVLDTEVEKVDWEQVESPEPTVNPLSAVAGLGRQIERQGLKLSAALEDTAYRAEQVTDAIDALEDPEAWTIRRSSRRLRDSSLQMAKRAQDPLGNVKTVTQNYGATLADVASNFGMTLSELLQLNPALARAPFVAANTAIQVYVRS
jgi:hypothetical protein